MNAGRGAAAFGALVLASAGAQGADSMEAGEGRALYVKHCAGCHGEALEGQPDWRRRLPSGRMPAPPHDASGHTWHHPDQVLFEITKHGPRALVGGGYESDMPGFEGVLSDPEIRAVLDYIKSTWPERQRTIQSERSRAYQDAARIRTPRPAADKEKAE